MRPLLKTLSAVSLILCFACLVLGIRGIWQSDTISFSWKNNLTGNTSGVCPKCGIPTNPPRSRPL